MFAFTVLVAPAEPQTVWFSPQSGGSLTVPDYMQLFRPDAPWATAASYVSVMGISQDFFWHRPDDELKEVLADLKRRGIKLGIPISPLAGRPTPEAPECGVGVEGFSAPPQALAISRKIKRLGGTVDYFSMDEPFYFGHVYVGDPKHGGGGKHRGCQLSIDDVAQDAAKRIKDIHSVFPDAKVGDGEPFAQFDERQWQQWMDDLPRWFDAFQSATGERLAYFRVDLWWRSPWQQRMAQLKKLLDAKQIPLQIIYDGPSWAQSDRIWIDEAEQHFKDFEGVNRISPSGVVIQSWTAKPSHALPENDPGTLTNLVLRYANWKRANGQTVSRVP
ncbi:MAG: hypothetical protein JO121_31910 [Deltaproteobacteria bacterium]|nr:hypothetical protein [Deltaproteobacteria bacterium]